MTLQEYYDSIFQELEKGNYKIIRKNTNISMPKIYLENLHNEALNYMIYEYLEDHKDTRRLLIFDYFLKPKNLGNKSKINFDFNSISFDEFFHFMLSIKN